MTRNLLFLLFLVMLAGDTLGINLSLAPGISVKNLFLYLILTAIAFETALQQNRRLELLSVIVPYTTCFFYALVTIIFVVLIVDYPSYELLESLVSLKGSLADNLAVLLVFFYGTLKPKDTLSLIKMMVWTVVAANLITVIDGFNMPDLNLIHEREDGRISGPIGEANQFAAFLALFMPASIALILIERGVRQKLAAIGFVATSLALLMTASRGGLVGVFAGTIIGALFLRQYISAKVAMYAAGFSAAFATAAVGVLYFAGYGELLYDRVIGLTTEGNSFDVSSGRNYIWGTALTKMMEHPLSLISGYGWDAYRQAFTFRFAPHNTYLKIYFELGMVGLLLVLITFVNVLRVSRKGLQNADPEVAKILFAFVFGMLGILVAIFFVDIHSAWLFVWAYVGAVMRLSLQQFDLAASATGMQEREEHAGSGHRSTMRGV